MVYCGDGVSDISAARETDLLFAKKGRDLVRHCLNENVPFYPFDVEPPFFNKANGGRPLRRLILLLQNWRAGRRRLPRLLNREEY